MSEGVGAAAPAVPVSTGAPQAEVKTSKSAENQSKAPEAAQEPDWGSYKRKVKINGVEREMSAEEAFKKAMLGEAANEKFTKASEIEKAQEAFKQKLMKNPVKALMELGIDREQARELAERDLIDFIKEDQMDPALKEKMRLEKELEEYKSKEQKAKEEQQQKAEQERLVKEIQAVDEELGSAFAQSNLPAVPLFMKWAAQLIYSYAQNNVDIPAKVAIKEVENYVFSEFAPALAKMDVPTLRNILGKDNLKRLREEDVKAVKQAESPFAKQFAAKQAPAQVTSPKGQKSPEPIKQSDFFSKLRGETR